MRNEIIKIVNEYNDDLKNYRENVIPVKFNLKKRNNGLYEMSFGQWCDIQTDMKNLYYLRATDIIAEIRLTYGYQLKINMQTYEISY